MAEITMTELRDTVYMLMYNNVCKNVYMDFLPSSTSNLQSEMVMLDFKSAISDFNAYKNGVIRVWICVKDSDRGAIMNRMENSFNNAISEYRASRNSGKIELSKRHVYMEHIAGNSLRCMIIELRVKLKENNI